MLKLQVKGVPIPCRWADIEKLPLFQKHPEIKARGSYDVASDVDHETFGVFLEKVLQPQTEVQITQQNVHGLRSLCDEFGFTGLDKELREFESFDISDTPNVRQIVTDLTESMEEKDIYLVSLEERLAFLEEQFEDMKIRMDVQNHKIMTCQSELRMISQQCEEVSQRTNCNHKEVLNKISKATAQLAEQLTTKVDKSELDTLAEQIKTKIGSSQLDTPTREIEIEKTETDTQSSNGHIFRSDKDPFSGIFAHLREKCAGNPHEKGLVEFSASTTARNQCQRLVDYGWGNRWLSQNRPDQFVQCDFKGNRVAITEYSLKTGDDCFPMTWVVEVSNDGSAWVEVDRRNSLELVGKWVVKTYKCARVEEQFYRFVRIRQTGQNISGSNVLSLSQLEIFGKLIESG